jgi:hypothetical protein
MVVAAAAAVVLALLPAGVALESPDCLALPIVEGQRGGGDYRNFELPAGANASAACRAACCADQGCAFWGLDAKLPPPSRRSCTQGKACCWLKTDKASRVNPPCAWGCYTGSSGRGGPPPPPAPPPPPPPPPFKCHADEDCALAGTCDVPTGTCKCFDGFLAPDCGALDIKPTPLSNGWRPHNFTTWGGSPVKVGDTYHLFASLNRWVQKTAFFEPPFKQVETDRFTKTGSGHTWKTLRQEAFFAGLRRYMAKQLRHRACHLHRRWWALRKPHGHPRQPLGRFLRRQRSAEPGGDCAAGSVYRAVLRGADLPPAV